MLNIGGTVGDLHKLFIPSYIKEGILDERRKNARTMNALGLPLETIAKVTGMSVEEIEKL